MNTLNETDPHYVRCIKPNDDKKSDLFRAKDCLDQLRYAGVFEAVKIRQQGFPFRWTHEVFFKRYRACGEAYKVFPRLMRGGGFRYADLSKKVRCCAAHARWCCVS